MLRCREVVQRVTRSDLGALPWREWAAVRIHLLLCTHCRAYTRSLRRLRRLTRAFWQGIPELGAQRLARLRAQVLRER